MDIKCEYCGAPYIPAEGSIDFIDEAPACECDLDKQLEKINNPSAKVYKNHCWKCKSKIDSRVCERDPERDNGFKCKNCGESMNDPAASCRVSDLAYSNNLSCLREVSR
jgi:DNA-directed RNA polymerase subunit RPC12/RpoP